MGLEDVLGGARRVVPPQRFDQVIR
jgi:hypothetical protein